MRDLLKGGEQFSFFQAVRLLQRAGDGIEHSQELRIVGKVCLVFCFSVF